jgi:peptidoglycan/LPS O-acetylase OafA/YrhL
LFCAKFLNTASAFGSIQANFEGTIVGILDLANFRVLQVFGRYESGASFPYWSLSLEEQFYFLLPVVVLLSRRRLPLVMAFVVLAQIFVTRSGPNTTSLGAFLNQTRSDALCLGVLIAIWSRHPTYRLFEPVGLEGRPILRVAILFFLLFLFASIGSQQLHLGLFQVGIVAILSAIMVLIASYNRDYLCAKGVFKRIMLWVGSRSYGIYLIHIPTYFMTREIWYRIEPLGTVFTSVYSLRFGLTAAALLLTLTELNYRIVEVPLRKRGARIAQRLAHRAV